MALSDAIIVEPNTIYYWGISDVIGSTSCTELMALVLKTAKYPEYNDRIRETLRNSPGDLYKVNSDAMSPLLYAAMYGTSLSSLNTIRILIEADRSIINHRNLFGDSALIIAIKYNINDDVLYEILTYLLSISSEHINTKNYSNESPLSILASSKNMKCVQLLLAHGADVDQLAKHSMIYDSVTPLIIAIILNNDELIHLLIPYSKNLNKLSGDGICPLTYAILYSNPQIAELLILRGADPNIKCVPPFSPVNMLIMKIIKGEYNMNMLDYFDLNVRDVNGNNPLMYAASVYTESYMRPHILKLMVYCISRNVDLSIRNNRRLNVGDITGSLY
jgi:ankyrin repeat protein